MRETEITLGPCIEKQKKSPFLCLHHRFITRHECSHQYDRTKLKNSTTKEQAKRCRFAKLKDNDTVEDVNIKIEKLKSVVKSTSDVILKPYKNKEKKR